MGHYSTSRLHLLAKLRTDEGRKWFEGDTTPGGGGGGAGAERGHGAVELPVGEARQFGEESLLQPMLTCTPPGHRTARTRYAYWAAA